MTRPDDLHRGTFIVVTGRKIEDDDEPMGMFGMSRRPSRPQFDGRPLEVKEVSLPFVAVNDGGRVFAVDVREWDVQVVSRGYVRAMVERTCESRPTPMLAPKRKRKQKPDPKPSRVDGISGTIHGRSARTDGPRWKWCGPVPEIAVESFGGCVGRSIPGEERTDLDHVVRSIRVGGEEVRHSPDRSSFGVNHMTAPPDEHLDESTITATWSTARIAGSCSFCRSKKRVLVVAGETVIVRFCEACLKSVKKAMP